MSNAGKRDKHNQRKFTRKQNLVEYLDFSTCICSICTIRPSKDPKWLLSDIYPTDKPIHITYRLSTGIRDGRKQFTSRFLGHAFWDFIQMNQDYFHCLKGICRHNFGMISLNALLNIDIDLLSKSSYSKLVQLCHSSTKISLLNLVNTVLQQGVVCR